ncbi:MAG: type II secretion system protein [Magnetococcales bacterium]|nr:type II secretion system protein [Magnetococcales bacterium]
MGQGQLPLLFVLTGRVRAEGFSVRPSALRGGFTLIELIVFILVVAIAMLAIVPLYLQVAVGAKSTREMLQGQYLAQERLEQMVAEVYKGGGFSAITAANFPSETNLNIGANINFDRTVVIEGATFAGGTLTCNGNGVYTSESYKCVYIRVYRSGSTANVLGYAWTSFSS